MPPSAKNKKKNAKTKKAKETNINRKEDDDSEIRKAELMKRALHLETECSKEGAATDEFRQRLEKLHFFWDVEKKALQEKKEVLEKKKSQLRSNQDNHRPILDAKRQEIKLLLSEQEDEQARLKMITQVELKELQSQHQVEENELMSDRNECHAKLQEIELSHNDFLKRLQDGHSSRITELRHQFRHRSSDIALYSERQLKRTREETEKKKRDDIKQVERTVEDRVGQALSRHEKEIEETRQHYNDLIHENLDIIRSLKEQIFGLRKEQRKRDKALEEVSAKNVNIVQPLSQGMRDLERLVERDKICKRQKEALTRHQDLLRASEEELSALKWRHEVLYQKYKALEKERDASRTAARQKSHMKSKGSRSKIKERQQEDKDPFADILVCGKASAT